MGTGDAAMTPVGSAVLQRVVSNWVVVASVAGAISVAADAAGGH